MTQSLAVGLPGAVAIHLRNRNGLRPRLFLPGGDYFDPLQLYALDSEKSGHLNDLAASNEIRGVGAESLNAGIKLATTHAAGYIESNSTLAVFLELQTELTDDHLRNSWILRFS